MRDGLRQPRCGAVARPLVSIRVSGSGSSSDRDISTTVPRSPRKARKRECGGLSTSVPMRSGSTRRLTRTPAGTATADLWSLVPRSNAAASPPPDPNGAARCRGTRHAATTDRVRQRAEHRAAGGTGGLYECNWVHGGEATGTSEGRHRWRPPIFESRVPTKSPVRATGWRPRRLENCRVIAPTNP
jgi:hypothetical protein